MVEFSLTGPEGNNPLGFLTALGAILTLDDAGQLPRLRWDGVTPHLVGPFDGLKGETEEEGHSLLVQVLYTKLRRDRRERADEAAQAKKNMERAKTAVKKKQDDIKRRRLDRAAVKEARRQELEPLQEDLRSKTAAFKKTLIESAADPSIALGKNLTEPNAELINHTAAACEQSSLMDRRWADLAAAYGIADPSHPEERMQASPWALVSGSGHQDFLSTVEELMLQCTTVHLRQALFDRWTPIDEKYSLRLDTADDRRYALMDRDPTAGDNKPRTLWGANRLAFEALRFFPAMPIREGMGVRTWRAVNGNWQENCRVRWPLWRQPIGVLSIQSLLGLHDLWREDPSAGERLNNMGVHAVMESRRIAVGQGANRKYNLTPAIPVWISSFREEGAAV